MIVLGIETSCDETAVALVGGDKSILFHGVSSQIELHKLFGGVVPEIAARAHLQTLPPMIDQALRESGLTFKDISAIAATCGPGLIGGVMVGAVVGKAIALSHGIPFLAINHIAAHALTPRLTNDIPFPYLTLLMSGGHTLLALVKSPVDFEILGTTLDDAVGECIDKIARLLDLPYPGGAALEALAQGGDGARFALPIPKKIHQDNPPHFNFSFSGLKSAARRMIEGGAIQSEQDRKDMAAALQKNIGIALGRALGDALRYCRDQGDTLHGVVAAGGVAANQYFRDILKGEAEKNGQDFFVPPTSLCTDNGAMIAWAGVEKLKIGHRDPIDFKSRPTWPIDQINV